MRDFSLILISVIICGAPLALQGFWVMREKNGYRKDPKFKDHPELKGVRKGDRMLYISFSKEGSNKCR